MLVGSEWLSPPPGARRARATGFDSPDDPCRLVLSSGTTGVPKVISVTERMLQFRFARSAVMLERGRYLSMMGFSTLGGYQMLMSALVLGGAVCFAGAPEDVLQVIALYHVTQLIAAPFQVRLAGSAGQERTEFPFACGTSSWPAAIFRLRSSPRCASSSART